MRPLQNDHLSVSLSTFYFFLRIVLSNPLFLGCVSRVTLCMDDRSYDHRSSIDELPSRVSPFFAYT